LLFENKRQLVINYFHFNRINFNNIFTDEENKQFSKAIVSTGNVSFRSRSWLFVVYIVNKKNSLGIMRAKDNQDQVYLILNKKTAVKVPFKMGIKLIDMVACG
jgi:hypothetical protein